MVNKRDQLIAELQEQILKLTLNDHSNRINDLEQQVLVLTEEVEEKNKEIAALKASLHSRSASRPKNTNDSE